VRVSVVIPTRNEAEAIARVLADLPSASVNKVIVVDNCSSDDTPRIAARIGVRVIPDARRGYGQSCLTGIASTSNPDVVVFLDGDCSGATWFILSRIVAHYFRGQRGRVPRPA
jgi:glycosyltransferase involved in cell wall biosynthesis